MWSFKAATFLSYATSSPTECIIRTQNQHVLNICLFKNLYSRQIFFLSTKRDNYTITIVSILTCISSQGRVAVFLQYMYICLSTFCHRHRYWSWFSVCILASHIQKLLPGVLEWKCVMFRITHASSGSISIHVHMNHQSLLTLMEKLSQYYNNSWTVLHVLRSSSHSPYPIYRLPF